MKNLNVSFVNYDNETYNYSYSFEFNGENHNYNFSTYDKLSEDEMNETARMGVDMYINY
jgi:predicted heme/steroid binding protein